MDQDNEEDQRLTTWHPLPGEYDPPMASNLPDAASRWDTLKNQHHPIAWISSSLVLGRVPFSGSFTLAKRSELHGLISGEYSGCARISNSRSARGP